MPIDPTKMPTSDDRQDIDGLFKHLIDEWDDSRRHFKIQDAFYQQEYDVWPEVPREETKERTKYHSSRPTNAIDHAVDTQLAFDPSIHRPPAGTGVQHKEDADSIEPAAKGILDEAFTKQTTHPPKQAGRQLLLYGYTPWAGPIWSEMDKPLAPVQGRGETNEDFERREEAFHVQEKFHNPLDFFVPGPAEVLMDWRLRHPPIAIYHKRFAAHELETLSSDKVARKQADYEWHIGENGDPYEEIEAYEVWTAFYRSLWTVQNQTHIFTQVNWTNWQPFCHGFAGFGQMPTDPTRQDPRFMCKGLLDPIMESIRMRDQRLIGQHALAMKAAWVKQGTTGDPQAVARQAQADMYQGDANLLWWERPPEIPQWMFQHGSEVDDDIEQGSFTLALGGFRQTGVSTVGQQAILSGAANKKFAGPIKQLENLVTVSTQGLLTLVLNLSRVTNRTGLDIGEYSIKATKLHNNTNVKVEFKQIDPIAALQEREQAQNEYQMGLLDKAGYWSVARKEDATSIRKGLVRDRVEELPRVKTLADAAALREFGYRDLARKLEEEALGGGDEETIFGPNGQPISTPASRGGGGGGGGGGAPLNPLNQGLTPQNFNPDRPAQQALAEL